MFFVIGFITSLIIKLSLDTSVSVFSNNISTKIQNESDYKGLIRETAIAFSYALAELGFIFVWLLLEKPDEYFSELNQNHCKTL